MRQAFRQLAKAPIATTTIILTLALCIGANTAIYSVIDALFFRPLPYPHPGRLVLLATKVSRNGMTDMSTSQNGQEWEDIRDRATFLDAAVYGPANGVNLVSGHRALYILDQRVGANTFRVLGVKPLLGREFTREEDVPNGPALTILSYRLWQTVFHGDAGIIGRSILLRGIPHTVVGVLPARFRSLPAGFGTTESPDAWTPLRPSTSGEGSGSNYGVVARLKDGVTAKQANEQLKTIAADIAKRRGLPKDVTVEELALPLRAGLTGYMRRSLQLMWSAVGLVLLIGCVNIAAVLLTRSSLRGRELAMRRALGASRLRIIGSLLTESMLLGIAGGALGIWFGRFALAGLVALNKEEFSLLGPVSLDGRVLLVTCLITIGASLLFGLAPAIAASRVDLRSTISEMGRTMAGNRGTYRRYALVFAELALTVLLVISAGLFARTFLKAWQENPGFDPSHLTIASASMQDARYSKTADGARLFRETVERIEHIPGVESAAVALSSPFTRPLNDWVPEVNGKAADAITDLNYGTPHLFDTLRTRLLRGRTFTERDDAASPRVAVVNEAFVKRYLKNLADPIGATFKTEDQRWTIIGVVSSVEEENGMSGTAPVGYLPEAYVPVQQFPDGLFEGANRWFSPVWIVRTRASDAELESRIRRAIASVDPMLPLASFKKIDLLHEDELARERYRAIVLSSLATLALVLAALGVYGLTAQSVAQRTREMGIRMALGATTQKVIGHSAAPAIGIASAAIATGVAAALYVTRLMKDLIWNIEPTDLTTYAAVIIVLLAVTALAAIVPAMKLVRLDPAQVLHEE